MINRQQLLAQLYYLHQTFEAGREEFFPYGYRYREQEPHVGVDVNGNICFALPTIPGEYIREWSSGSVEMTEKRLPDGRSFRTFYLLNAELLERFTDLMLLMAVTLGDTDLEPEMMQLRAEENLTQWRELFSEMSSLSLLGLYGELVLLRLFADLVGREQAMNAWIGPWRRKPQDFSSPNGLTLLDSKAKFSGSTLIDINGAHQLELPEGAEMLLGIVRGRVKKPSNDATQTLTHLYDTLVDLPHQFGEDPRFDEGCLREGFTRAGGNNLARREVELERIEFFRIDENFPKIVPGALPEKVDPVTLRYKVDISAIDPFFVLQWANGQWPQIDGSVLSAFLGRLGND